jgi:hypothetical protein
MSIIYRSASSFSKEERQAIIEEQNTSPLSNSSLWEKYTGSRKEQNTLNLWRKQLGYPILTYKERQYFREQLSHNMSNKAPSQEKLKTDQDVRNMAERIRSLEAELEAAKLKAEGYQLMVHIAETELKIPIRKKSDTK